MSLWLKDTLNVCFLALTIFCLLPKRLMRGFAFGILPKNGFLAQFEAPNHTVNPDLNFEKSQFFAKSAMSLFFLLILCSRDILGTWKDMLGVFRFKFVDHDGSSGRLNILLKF